MTNLRHVPTKSLDPAAFSVFGVVLSPEGRTRLPINTYGDRLNLFREGFETDQPIEWFIAEGFRRVPEALFLERHKAITQTFIPLGNDPFVMLVAPPDAEEGPDRLPLAALMRAFIVPGNAAVQLHRGTWHENPFPLRDGQRFLVTSHAALTRGHQGSSGAALQDLPLDLERRFFAESGVHCTVDLDV
jgi:ureidoglycolate lyase